MIKAKSINLKVPLRGIYTHIQNPSVCVSEGGARGRWKALKAESRLGVDQMEALLRSVQERVQQIHSRRHTLTQLIQHLRSTVRPHSFQGLHFPSTLT